MRFYCPVCLKEYDVEPTKTVTTKSNRVAYKANCPICQQDMAEFIPETGNQLPTQMGVEGKIGAELTNPPAYKPIINQPIDVGVDLDKADMVNPDGEVV